MADLKIIEIKQSIFADNDADAQRLRDGLKQEKTFLLNLMSSPGSGKTTTLLRTLEKLKDKLAKGQTVIGGGEVYGGTGITVIPENKSSEAAAALAVLGYSQAEINLALKGIDMSELTLEQIIKAALKKMMKS